LRTGWFHEWKEVYTLPTIKWKCYQAPEGANVVLTDHPVCQTSGTNHYILVPISRRRIIIGGVRQSLEELVRTAASTMVFNLLLTGWASDWIYAAERHTLEGLKATFTEGAPDLTDAWLAAARQPLFGLPSRIQPDTLPPGASEDVFSRIELELLTRGVFAKESSSRAESEDLDL
jgi:hypothetical protein